MQGTQLALVIEKLGGATIVLLIYISTIFSIEKIMYVFIYLKVKIIVFCTRNTILLL